MKKTITLLFLVGFIATSTAWGQEVKERLIITDDKDSTLLKAWSVNFDIEGNYLFDIKKDDKHYFRSNNGTIGPLEFNSSSTVSKFTSISNNKETYYQTSSTKLIGPIIGEDLDPFRYPQSQNLKHVAIPYLIKDSIVIFLDNNVVIKLDTLSGIDINIDSKKASPYQAKKNSLNSGDWLSFSDNGNYIFSVENNLKHRLFVNNNPIDSSKNEFYQMRINNNGEYIYAKGRKPLKGEHTAYDYMFFIHSKDTVLGPVRTAWNCYLKENGGYYYSGDDNGPDYIIINNALFKNLDSIANITIVDRKNYLFSCKEGNARKVKVNGKSYTYPFKDIFYPTLDNKGNFAFYGLKGYYLYKFVNGKQEPEPITKYGIRPVPLYISPLGKSLHYFKTDDSTYIYLDEKMIFPAFANTTAFKVIPGTDVLPSSYERGQVENGNSLLYMELDSTGYFIYNGVFSKPTIPAKRQSYSREQETGAIVAGKFDDNGFYFIQKTGAEKFLININNTTYKEIEGVQQILRDNCFYDGKTLVFYGTKGFSFYQFSLTL